MELKMYSKKISTLLKTIRLSENLSLRNACKKLDSAVGPTTLQYYENDGVSERGIRLAYILWKYGLDLNQIFSQEGNSIKLNSENLLLLMESIEFQKLVNLLTNISIENRSGLIMSIVGIVEPLSNEKQYRFD